MIGIKISKPGVDVSTATDRELIYSSGWKSFKIYKQGSGTANSSGQASITHGLDFAPAFIVYDTNNWKGTGYYSISENSYVTSTSLEVRTSASKDYAYTVFANPLEGISSLRPSDTFGLNVSQSGKNVQTAKLHELEFTSGLGTLQVWQKQELGCELTDDVWDYSEVTHGLGFIPAFMGLFGVRGVGAGLYPTDWYQLSNNMEIYDIPAGKYFYGNVCVDSQKIYFKSQVASMPETTEGGYASYRLFLFEKLV